jgi:hypothetical protein
MGEESEMRKIALFAVPAAVIQGLARENADLFVHWRLGMTAGIGAWAASTTQARLETAPEVRIDPFQIMMNSKDLPVEELFDYSFVYH